MFKVGDIVEELEGWKDIKIGDIGIIVEVQEQTDHKRAGVWIRYFDGKKCFTNEKWLDALKLIKRTDDESANKIDGNS